MCFAELMQGLRACVALVLRALFSHGAERSVTDAAAPALLALVQAFPDAFQAAGEGCGCLSALTAADPTAGLHQSQHAVVCLCSYFAESLLSTFNVAVQVRQ